MKNRLYTEGGIFERRRGFGLRRRFNLMIVPYSKRQQIPRQIIFNRQIQAFFQAITTFFNARDGDIEQCRHLSIAHIQAG